MIIGGAIFLGLLLGSFLSVLIERWPTWRGAGTGRSRCPQCAHELAWFDLIPLVSWIAVGGKCRYCQRPISKLYPILEISMATVLGLYAYLYGVPTGWFAIDYLILALLVALFFFDFRHQVLPDVIVGTLAGIVLLRLISLRADLLVNSIATGALLMSLLGLLYIISKGRWLGFGDVKLAFAIGVLFGYPMAVGVTLIAIWSGALVGIGMIARRRATMETALPFGSFWAAAAILAVLAPGPVAFLSGLFIPILK